MDRRQNIIPVLYTCTQPVPCTDSHACHRTVHAEMAAGNTLQCSQSGGRLFVGYFDNPTSYHSVRCALQ